jgi:hypothetical protein
MTGCGSNLGEFTEMFVAAVRLTEVYSAIRRINDDSLSNNDQESLQWAGTLVGNLDNYSRHHTGYNDLACTLRPHFYGAFLEMRSPADRDFLDRLYDTLESGGKKQLLSPEELKVAEGLVKHLLDYTDLKLRVPSCL